jgi:hypothetical protein
MQQRPCRFFLYLFSCGVITDQSIAKERMMQLTDACYWRGLIGIDQGVIIGGFSSLPHISTLIKKEIKFSSYIRKFRMEQLQGHI